MSSKNAILPILYFIYHKNLTEHIVNSVSQKENRKLIKKWLLRALIFKPFGRSADTVFTNTRRAFIKEFKQGSNKYFDNNTDLFPFEKIEKEAKYTRNIDDEFLEYIMMYRKNDPETFAILSLLYPNLDYKNNDFHKDHLHAQNLYKEYKKIGEERKIKTPNYNYLSFELYDALPNLQMLDANENEAKQDKLLKQWVEESCKNESDRKEFLERHLIPDINLSLENFDNFYELRKKLLIDKLKKILN